MRDCWRRFGAAWVAVAPTAKTGIWMMRKMVRGRRRRRKHCGRKRLQRLE